MISYTLRAHAYQSGIMDHHQPLPLIPAKNMTQLKTGKLQRTNDTDAQRGDFFIVSDNYERYRVQPLSPFAATNHGVVRRTKIIPKTTAEDQNGPLEDNQPQGSQDTFAVFGFANGNLSTGFILGHIIPQVSQMQFKDIDYMDRHHTDNVHLMDNDGNRADYAADGTGVVIAAPGKDKVQDHDPGHDGYKHFDEKDMPWLLKPTQKNEYTINQQSGGTRLKFDTEGNIALQHQDATVQIHGATGQISLTSKGNQGINTPKLTIDAPSVHITGTLHADQVIANNIQSISGSVPGPLGGGGAATPDPGSPVRNTLNQEPKPWKYGP